MLSAAIPLYRNLGAICTQKKKKKKKELAQYILQSEIEA